MLEDDGRKDDTDALSRRCDNRKFVAVVQGDGQVNEDLTDGATETDCDDVLEEILIGHNSLVGVVVVHLAGVEVEDGVADEAHEVRVKH